MSDWEYDSYTGAEWNKDLELFCPAGRDGMIKLEPNGNLTVGCEDYGSCCGGSSMNEQFGRLTLEQAIELSTYINCVMIPNLEEGASE